MLRGMTAHLSFGLLTSNATPDIIGFLNRETDSDKSWLLPDLTHVG